MNYQELQTLRNAKHVKKVTPKQTNGSTMALVIGKKITSNGKIKDCIVQFRLDYKPRSEVYNLQISTDPYLGNGGSEFKGCYGFPSSPRTMSVGNLTIQPQSIGSLYDKLVNCPVLAIAGYRVEYKDDQRTTKKIQPDQIEQATAFIAWASDREKNRIEIAKLTEKTGEFSTTIYIDYEKLKTGLANMKNYNDLNDWLKYRDSILESCGMSNVVELTEGIATPFTL